MSTSYGLCLNARAEASWEPQDRVLITMTVPLPWNDIATIILRASSEDRAELFQSLSLLIGAEGPTGEWWEGECKRIAESGEWYGPSSKAEAARQFRILADTLEGRA